MRHILFITYVCFHIWNWTTQLFKLTVEYPHKLNNVASATSTACQTREMRSPDRTGCLTVDLIRQIPISLAFTVCKDQQSDCDPIRIPSSAVHQAENQQRRCISSKATAFVALIYGCPHALVSTWSVCGQPAVS